MSCKKNTNDLDIEIWNIHRNLWPDEQEWNKFRKWVKDQFDLRKDHWDQGWGWSQVNPDYAFCKMLNAGFLLGYGIDSSQRPKGYGGQNLSMLVSSIYENRQDFRMWYPDLVISEGNALYIFGKSVPNQTDYDNTASRSRSLEGSLVCYKYSQTINNEYDWSFIDITKLVGFRYKIYSIIGGFVDSNGNLNVFSKKSDDDIFHFIGDISGNWTASSILDEPNILTFTSMHGRVKNPVVQNNIYYSNPSNENNSVPMIHLFGNGKPSGGAWNWNLLYHYYFTPEGEWFAEEVPFLTEVPAYGGMNLVLKVFNGNNQTFYLLGQTQSPSGLILLSWDPNNGWKEELLLGQTTSPDGFVLKSWNPNDSWKEEIIAIGRKGFDSNMVGPAVLRKENGDIHIFIRENSGDLYEIRKKPNSDWYVENLTKRPNLHLPTITENAYSLRTAPSAIIDSDENIHVFAVSKLGSVLDYHHIDCQTSLPSLHIHDWRAKIITYDSNYDAGNYSCIPRVIRRHETLYLFIDRPPGDIILYMWVPYLEIGTIPSQWLAFNLTRNHPHERSAHAEFKVIVGPDDSIHLFWTATKGLFPSELDLIHYTDSGQGHTWHSNEDYERWASGYEHGFRYEPEDAYSRYGPGFTTWAVAKCGGWIFKDNLVEMWCPSFSDDIYTIDPGNRAATMLHESAHIIYGGLWGVKEHGIDYSGTDPVKKDHWHHHLLGEPGYGVLLLDKDQKDKTGHKHMSYQIQVEYLADLAEFGHPWISDEIKQLCKTEANNLMANHFWNPPAWRVGDPRPL